MWDNFFDVLGTITAWGMYVMLAVTVFVIAKAILSGLWMLLEMLL
jgi:hypothetical protein